MWTRLRSKAAGAGLKGAAGALETLGCQNRCTEEAIPGAPGEEADLLGQSAELRAGVRAGAARGEEAEATVLGCLAPPAVLSPSQAFLVCSVDRGFTATAPWGVKGDTVSALQAVREASAAWGGVGPGREGGWGASSFHQGELFPSHRGPHRAQGISQDYA